MSILNFPSSPYVGQLYTLGTVTYQWSGSAWLIYNSGAQTFSNVTATGTIIIGSTTSNVTITATNVTINGASALTTSSILPLFQAGTDISISTATGNIAVSDTSTLQSVTTRGATTTNAVKFNNTTNSTSTITGSVVVAGGIGVGGDVWVQGRVNSESVQIADSIFDSTAILVNTTATVVVDSYSATEFRSSKYMVQIDEGTGPTAHFEVIEILLLVDNIGTVYATEYGVLTSNGEMGDFAADVQGDNVVRLYFTPYAATNKIIKVLRTAMTV